MSIARQLAQAVLGLALLGHVARLAAAAVHDRQPTGDPQPPPADPGPTWVRDQRGVLLGGDVGGDAPARRVVQRPLRAPRPPRRTGRLPLLRRAGPGQPHHHLHGAADRAAGLHRPEDPGGTEVWSDYRYETVQRGLGSVEAATTAARRAAEAHLACDEAWSGRPPWDSE